VVGVTVYSSSPARADRTEVAVLVSSGTSALKTSVLDEEVEAAVVAVDPNA
jgi:hypothetical protein